MRTRRLTQPWPFLYSCIPGRGWVQNLPPKPKPPRRLKRIPPSSEWKQDPLI